MSGERRAQAPPPGMEGDSGSVVPVPLLSGAYAARSLVASAQRCVNLYLEKNPEGSEKPTTAYPTPGLRLLNEAGVAQQWRCLYLGSNGVIYGVIGNSVVYLAGDFEDYSIGTIATSTGPCYIRDNTIYAMLVDGSGTAYKWDLATNTFATVVDPNFLGADKIDYLDGYFLFNQPGTRNFYSTLANSETFDALYFGTKVGWMDDLVTIAVVETNIWLLGSQRSEIWYNAGTEGFPFARIPGAYVSHGCAAKYSVAQHGDQLFWLSQDESGPRRVLMGKNYDAIPVSTHAIEKEIASYTVVSDAIGMCYQQEGHIFYVLVFPTADKTWCFDLQTGQWHERCWLDENGVEHRIRPNCLVHAYEQIVVGDWSNGTLYSWDLDTYTDAGDPILRLRSFFHLVDKGRRVIHWGFQADMECGSAEENWSGDPAEVRLRWSDDRGRSYGNSLQQSFGGAGQYLVRPTWNRLGQAMDRVFELSWSANAKTAVLGAWIWPEQCES
jgi:hypothetical protein